MNSRSTIRKSIAMLAAIVASNLLFAQSTLAADIKGQVLGGGAPIAKSTVTLWEASADAPKQLAQTKTSDDGRFEVRTKGAHSDAVLYLLASGGDPRQAKRAAIIRPLFSSPCWEAIHRTGCRERTHDRRVRVHQCAVHQRRGDLRQSARTQDRRRERSQPGGSGDRRLGQGTAGPAQQLNDHDDGEPGHARLADHGLVHGGQRRLARPLLQGRNSDRRSDAQEHP